MTLLYKQVKGKKITAALISCLLCLSCNKILEVTPSSKITFEQTFSDDLTAISAIRGVYGDMLQYAHAFSGANQSMQALLGLSADELSETLNTPILKQFENNALRANNEHIKNLWNSIYNTIYAANAVMNGIEQSESITENTKNSLKGEALFIRAFSHFYLVNIFGKVPIVITTDYAVNSQLSRQDTNVVYDQIITDLLEAEQLLNDEYINGERVRPVKATATALLARVYLFTNNWVKAEQSATTVIEDAKFSLVELADISLSNNGEAIWQLHSSSLTENAATNEGIYFLYPSYYNALRPEFIDAFETGDLRKIEWTQVNSGFLVPYKYRVSGSGGSRSEYSTVFRLAEPYLIRAEAKIQQDNIEGGVEDLNEIRSRARDENPGDLPDLPASLNKTDALLAVQQERKVELFTEWGHRWLDLKRWGIASEVLLPLKGLEWQNTDMLYPIPQIELDRNRKLGNQNQGY